MKNEDMEAIIKNIRDELGDENSAKISDNLTQIMNENSNLENVQKKHEEEIKDLKKTKEDLINTNGKLFQQIASGLDEEKLEKEKEEKEAKEEKKPFCFTDLFDKKGNFI